MTSTTVLVVAAHPDDEVLGCGGAITRHTAQGDRVHVLHLADGVTGRFASPDPAPAKDDINARKEAARAAASILGVSSVQFGDLPDNRLDSLPLGEVARLIESVLAQIHPTVVYTHHAGDLNQDHEVAHRAVAIACRPTPGASSQTLLFFETPSSTEWRPNGVPTPFAPNWFVDIGTTLAVKRRALEAYKTEMRPWPHARSIEAIEHLARWRGASCGCEAAEAFMLGRRIV